MSAQDSLPSDLRLCRIKCRLVGCYTDEYPCCERCGEDLYEGFISYGKLEPLFRLYWRMYRAIRLYRERTCDCCGKKFRSRRTVDVCSDECHENWLPF